MAQRHCCTMPCVAHRPQSEKPCEEQVRTQKIRIIRFIGSSVIVPPRRRDFLSRVVFSLFMIVQMFPPTVLNYSECFSCVRGSCAYLPFRVIEQPLVLLSFFPSSCLSNIY